MLNFEVWLVEQQARKDFIGVFACFWGMQAIPSVFLIHKVEEIKHWTVPISRIAKPEYITAFNEAWHEYLLAEEIAKNALV